MKTLFQKIWLIVSAILSLLGLSGLVDNFIEWHSFMLRVTDVYYSFRDMIFTVLPFTLSGWIKDYLVAGASIFSIDRIANIQMRALANEKNVDMVDSKGIPIKLKIFNLLRCLLGWPVQISFYLTIYILSKILTQKVFQKLHEHFCTMSDERKSLVFNEQGIIFMEEKKFESEAMHNGLFLMAAHSKSIFKSALIYIVIFLGLLFIFSDIVEKALPYFGG